MKKYVAVLGIQRKLTQLINHFFESAKAGGLLLILSTVISLALANSAIGHAYIGIWHTHLLGLSLEAWINDALMAVFFLLIGLELKREILDGELSETKKALLPIFAAAGGMIAPALIHYMLNAGTPTQPGIGIPVATDIVFALTVLGFMGNRVPAALKILLAALAVVDDLGAIIVIAVFYTADLSIGYLAGALAVFACLYGLNRFLKVFSLIPYLLGGMVMWFLMLKSGVHATLAGVLLAFAIPYSSRTEEDTSPSHWLEHRLHYPVSWVILPVFALANTGVMIGSDWLSQLSTHNSLGIIAGLALGKPFGIALLSFAAVALGICRLPADIRWRHVLGIGCLGGIGFTMSIFITNLAFADNAEVINGAKMAILAASVISAVIGAMILKWSFNSPENGSVTVQTIGEP